MSFEFSQDDLRAGNRQMMDKLAEHINKMSSGSKSKDFKNLEELDVESKLTIKDVAQAYNELLKAIKEQ